MLIWEILVGNLLQNLCSVLCLHITQLSRIHNSELWNWKKCTEITCATLLVLHSCSHHFPHIPPSLLLCVSVRQLSGLLPGTLHERTGGRTFLLNIALHSGDSLPSLCLCPVFVFVHFCLTASKSSGGLHFHRRLTSSCLLLFFGQIITRKMLFFCAQMQSAMHYFALMT